MTSLHRGLFWCAAYVALVVGPLASAWLFATPPAAREFRVELAVGLGFVAFGVLAVELALVARVRPVSADFGTDVLMLVHRWMGIAAIAFVLLHPLLLWGRGVGASAFLPVGGAPGMGSGAIAFWAAVLLVGSSLVRRGLRLSYGAWRTGHVLLAIIIVLSTSHHIQQVSYYSGDPIVARVTILWTAAFLALLAHYRLVRPLLLQRRPWRIVENRDDGGDVRTLVLRPEGHPGVAFRPGQFAWLTTGRTPFALDDHPISFSSSAEPREDRAVELSIKALGDWSHDAVPRLATGARVWIDGPYGAFTPDRAPAQGFVLIAGGIGITPMRSILLTLRDRGDRRPVLLIHAAHDSSRAVFTAELAALTAEMPLTIVRVHEAPAADDDAERGFVTPELLRRHLPPDARHRAFFCCGPPAMLDALGAGLAALGIAPDRIHAERFDMV